MWYKYITEWKQGKQWKSVGCRMIEDIKRSDNSDIKASRMFSPKGATVDFTENKIIPEDV